MTDNKSYTLGEIAELLNIKLVGDQLCEIHGLGTLKYAAPGQLTFLSNPSYINQLSSTKASAVIVEEKYVNLYSGNALVSENPYVSFAGATALFATPSKVELGVHNSAHVHDSVQLAENVSIGPNVVIEEGVCIGVNTTIGAGSFIGKGVILGDNGCLYNNVTLYHGVTIGRDVIIHSGAVIGADGFGFASDRGKSIKIHQLGSVEIGDDVETKMMDIHPAFSVQDGDILIRKERASAFHSTPLIAHLTRLGINSLIVCGESTSGCVRASVVDAYSNGYHVTIAEECVFDRSILSHKVNLFDMHHKYADVMVLKDIIAHLETTYSRNKAAE